MGKGILTDTVPVDISANEAFLFCFFIERVFKI